MSPIKDSAQTVSKFKNEKEAELSYKIIAENASDAIIRIDVHSTILFANRAAENIFGYEMREMIGRSLTMLMPGYLQEVHSAAIKRYLQTGEKNLDWNRVEVPGKHKNGDEISLEISFGEYLQDDEKFFVGVIRDVTERNKTEQAIRESERILQGTIDALTAHIAVLDHDGVIRKINEAWRNFADANDFEGENYGIGNNYIKTCESVSEVTTDCRLQGKLASDGIKDVIAGRKTLFELEYPCNSKTQPRWFIMRVTRYGDAGTLGVVVAHENITDRKIAEQETRISEEKYRVLSEAIPAFTFITNNEGSANFTSRQWYDYTGLTEKQTLGTGWTDAIHPDDLREVSKIWKEAITEGRIFESEYRLRSENGDYRWFLVRVVPRKDSKGNILEWFGSGIDIEDRKKVEEDLRASEVLNREVLESSPDCVKLLDEDGHLLYMNQNGVCLLEIDDFEPFRNKNWSDIWEEKDQHLINDAVESARHGETARFQAFCPTTKGKPKWWDVIVLRIGATDIKENSARLLAVSRDITETKRISEALLKAEIEQRKEAEAANLAKDEFLSVLSHELRTPLNAMLGWIRILKTGRTDKIHTEQAIDVIERNIILQNELIEDLLDVSRIISDKMLIEKQAVEFLPIVSNALDIARPLAEKKQIILSFNNLLGSQKVFGDDTRLHQIIINLLNNAVKFTPENGSVDVNLSIEKDFLQLEIKDDGVGIEPEFLPHIFERFRQGDSTTKRNHSGLGLGLTIVNHLTKLHDGRIEVSSDGLDKGSVFTLKFPLFREPQPDNAKSMADTEDHNSSGKSYPLSGSKILLVDDDIDGVIPLKILLEQRKAKVEITDSASRALALLAEKDFDILISDIGMPQSDGYELIENLRKSEKNKTIPAIALTAYASLTDREKALKCGFQKHMAKPLDFDELLKMLEELHTTDLNKKMS